MQYTILFNNPQLAPEMNPRKITREASSLKEAKKFVPEGCKLVSVTPVCESGVCARPVSDEEE